MLGAGMTLEEADYAEEYAGVDASMLTQQWSTTKELLLLPGEHLRQVWCAPQNSRLWGVDSFGSCCAGICPVHARAGGKIGLVACCLHVQTVADCKAALARNSC